MLRAMVMERISERPWTEWQARFATDDNVTAEPLARPGDALHHPQLVHTGDAAEVLLKRFTFHMDPSITDQEEKDAAFRGVLRAGALAIEPVRAFAAKAESLAWPMKIMKELVGESEYTEELLRWLSAWDTEYSKFVDPKVQVLTELEERRHPRIAAEAARFLEDVNEHPYRIERNLLQLVQAGVLDAQRAVVLGAFTAWKKSPNDRGYSLQTAIDRVRAATKTPILTGLPFGHVPTKVSLPVGARVRLLVDGRDAFIGW